MPRQTHVTSIGFLALNQTASKSGNLHLLIKSFNMKQLSVKKIKTLSVRQLSMIKISAGDFTPHTCSLMPDLPHCKNQPPKV